MLKLNDEQLSTVISAHTGGTLKTGGSHDFGLMANEEYDGYNKGCLIQVACNEPSCSAGKVREMGDEHMAAMQWFDKNYDENWSTKRLVEELVKAGIA